MSQFQTLPGPDLPFPAFLALTETHDDDAIGTDAAAIAAEDAAALSIALAVAGLEQPGDPNAHLRHLQDRLVTLLCGQERQPGLEAAADDLYRAAVCFLQAQSGSLAPPSSRHLRLLHNAGDRLQSRLAALHGG